MYDLLEKINAQLRTESKCSCYLGWELDNKLNDNRVHIGRQPRSQNTMVKQNKARKFL